jgi:pimeloyl-ACP methyl ester carboxylesterase
MKALVRVNLTRMLPNIVNRTLVITGTNDFTVPVTTQQYLIKWIPNVCQEIIQNAGHAVIVEKPDEINRILVEFLLN